jgi:outer membrane protein insertion porin family
VVFLSLMVLAQFAVTPVAQQPQASPEPPALLLCGGQVGPPAQLPPPTSGPVLYLLGLCFDSTDNNSIVEPETYLFHVRVRPSRPSEGVWVPYDEALESEAISDFRRLWATGFLDDLRIEVHDYLFANGVIGKVLAYHMEERPRIRVIDYDTGGILDRGKIDEALKEKSIELRSDGFLDERMIRGAAGVLREMFADKGYPDAVVTTKTAPLPGQKLVGVAFTARPGPRLRVRDVEFIGNHALTDYDLNGLVKANRPENLFSFATGGGVFNAAKFSDDAERVENAYRDRGFIQVRVGQPEVRPLDDSVDGLTRWVQLRVPVTEGRRFRIGSVSFDGNSALPTATLGSLFKLKTGDWYSQQAIRDGLEKAREVYGAAGYMEFTGFPELKPNDDPATPVVDIVMRVTEGAQYFVNRITFEGNVTTHDSVIRREFRLIEGGTFNTELLKYSVRRLNQLGYFKPLEGGPSDLKVEKTPGRDNAVDVVVKVEEQNRNQISVGAGVSQYEGIFGNLSYTTSNFLGRGESVTVAAQKGSRSGNYQLAFSEPYVFDRSLAAGFDLYSRKTDFVTGTGSVGYSEVRSGTTLSVARPILRFSRLSLSYGYEVIDVAASQETLNSLDSVSGVGVPVFNPYLDEGRHTESRVTPGFLLNSVDNPIMPKRGTKLSLSLPVTGGFFGGTTNYIKPEIDAVQYIPITRRTGFGVHAAAGIVRRFGDTHLLPYYVRYFLGGETQIRGVNIRTVGPTDKDNRAIGGDRYVLFNAEYYLDLFGPVRALVFHDAGQAYAENQKLDLTRLRTSSGLEVRFMMPVLNVPFRLIYAWNFYRDTFQPARGFKFAVGTTF